MDIFPSGKYMDLFSYHYMEENNFCLSVTCSFNKGFLP